MTSSILWILLLCFNPYQKTIAFDKNPSYINPLANASFLVEDGNQNFDIDRLNFSDFRPLKHPKVFTQLKNQTCWIRYTINNSSNENKTYFLMIYNAYLTTGQVIVQNELHSHLGFVHKNKKQRANHVRLNHPVWPVELAPGNNTFYVKFYDNATRTRILHFLFSKDYFVKWKIQSISLAAIFTLTILLIIFFILLGAYFIRAPYFLFYTLYLAGLLLDFLAYKGWGAAYMWRENEFFLDNVRSIGNALSTFGISFFFYNFYKEYKVAPWITSVFRIMGYYFSLFLLLYIVKGLFGELKTLFIYVFISIQAYALIIVAIHSYLAVKRSVPIYLPLVFIVHTLTVYLQTQLNLPINGSLYLDIFSVNMYYITLVLEIGVLTYYIFIKISEIRSKNIELFKQIKSLQKELEGRIEKTESLLKLKSKALIQVGEIIFIKSDDKYVEYFTSKGKEIDRDTLKNVLEKLPLNQFIRIHKSYVVNVIQIRQVFATKIMMRNGEYIPLSRTYKEQMNQYLI